jgi:UrcA family protein
MSSKLKTLVAGCTAVTLASWALAAEAGPPFTQTQVRVTSQDLDLTTEAGATKYLARLSRAAGEACGGGPDHSPLVRNGVRVFQDCHAKTLARAVAQSASPILQHQFAATQEAAGLRLARR